MPESKKPFYDFVSRVDDFRKRWSELFAKLVGLGYDKRKVIFEVKIVNEKKESVEILLSQNMIKHFVQAQKDPSVGEILKRISECPFERIDGVVAKIVGDKIVTKGEAGLAYVSHILPLFYVKIESRMTKSNVLSEEEKSKRIIATKKLLEKQVSDLISSCKLDGEIEFHVFYKKGDYYVIFKRSRKKGTTLRIEIFNSNVKALEKEIEDKISVICILLQNKK